MALSGPKRFFQLSTEAAANSLSLMHRRYCHRAESETTHIITWKIEKEKYGFPANQHMIPPKKNVVLIKILHKNVEIAIRFLLVRGCSVIMMLLLTGVLRENGRIFQERSETMAADLHCHTNCSDGSSTPEELAAYAKQAGLDAVAITDHDTLQGIPRAVAAGERLGITVVPGVEFSAMDLRRGVKVHLLCYLPSRPGVLDALSKKILPSRDRAFRESLRKVARMYPISERQALYYARDSASLYQVHIMRTLLEMGYTDQIYGELYDRLLGDGGVCKVPHAYLDMWETAERIKSAGGVCVMAHPSVYGSIDTMRELAAAGALDGIECSYPRARAEDAAAVAETVARYGLLSTGGTDFHGAYSALARPVGACTTDNDTVERIFSLAASRR